MSASPAYRVAAAQRELEKQIENQRMKDSFGGYDWGDPIILWFRHAPRPHFTFEQLAIADRSVGVAA